jgi:hypothetical protein
MARRPEPDLPDWEPAPPPPELRPSRRKRALALAEDLVVVLGGRFVLVKALRGGPVGIGIAAAQVLLMLRRRRRRRAHGDL